MTAIYQFVKDLPFYRIFILAATIRTGRHGPAKRQGAAMLEAAPWASLKFQPLLTVKKGIAQPGDFSIAG
jgi:hypothetical protein